MIYNDYMKNNKGFTLIELLTVITIISLLALTIGVSVSNSLEKSKYNEYEETREEICKAARIYIKLKSYDGTYPNINNLIEKGLLDDNILNREYAADKKVNPILDIEKFCSE